LHEFVDLALVSGSLGVVLDGQLLDIVRGRLDTFEFTSELEDFKLEGFLVGVDLQLLDLAESLDAQGGDSLVFFSQHLLLVFQIFDHLAELEDLSLIGGSFSRELLLEVLDLQVHGLKGFELSLELVDLFSVVSGLLKFRVLDLPLLELALDADDQGLESFVLNSDGSGFLFQFSLLLDKSSDLDFHVTSQTSELLLVFNGESGSDFFDFRLWRFQH